MEHEIPDQFDANAERGARPPEPGDERDGEALLHKCCADLGVNFAMALQIVAWAEEQGIAQSPKSEVQSSDETRLMAALIKILEYEWNHPGIIPAFAVRYVFNLPLLDDMISHHNPASFAATIQVSREAVNKEVKAALKFFGLPPRRGMRAAASCRNMSAARNRQLRAVKATDGDGGRRAEATDGHR